MRVYDLNNSPEDKAEFLALSLEEKLEYINNLTKLFDEQADKLEAEIKRNGLNNEI